MHKVLFVAIMLLSVGAVCALDIPAPQGYVSDFADLFSPADEARIAALAQEIEENTTVEIAVVTIAGLSAHAGRKELLDYSNRVQPRPNRIIIQHGEQSKCLDLASSIYKLHHIETNVPRNLETIRLR